MFLLLFSFCLLKLFRFQLVGGVYEEFYCCIQMCGFPYVKMKSKISSLLYSFIHSFFIYLLVFICFRFENGDVGVNILCLRNSPSHVLESIVEDE
eukprot:m.214074 g.214074  ORF g.214074 m.214074 type:complete len:95 (-) comp13797_c0_seq1:1067-1351(-)